MAKEKTPYDAVLDEIAVHSALTRDELDQALRGILDHLEERARETITTTGGESSDALEHAHQFLAFTEILNFYGTALIAFDDIDEESLPN